MTQIARRTRTLRFALIVAAVLLPAPLSAQPPERLTDWTHPSFPRDEYLARHRAADAAMSRTQVLLVPSAEGTSAGETFRQDADFLYFTGLEVARSVLVVEGNSGRTILFLPAQDHRFESVGRPNDFPGRALLADPAVRALSGVDAVRSIESLPEYVADLARRRIEVLVNTGGGAIDTPSGLLGAFAAPTPGVLFARYVVQQQPALSLGSALPLIASLRMIKSPREIAMLRESARITAQAMMLGARRVAPGTRERTLTGAFTSDCLALGAHRDAFTPIIKSGENSLWPWRILGAHYDRRNRQLRPDEMVIFDVGCEREHYVSDMGRTFPVNEQFTTNQRRLVSMVTRVSDAVIAAARPGLTFSELQAVALDAIPERDRRYMQASLFFGHHIGLEAGDPSLPDAVLAPGMVFTIEPWYYNHDDDVAVFIEDQLLITPTGAENLTRDLPRTVSALEGWRSARSSIPLSAAQLLLDDRSRTMTRDGVLLFALDSTTATLRVYDLLNGEQAATTPVCPSASYGYLTDNDVTFVVACPGTDSTAGTRPGAQFVNTATFTVGPEPTGWPIAMERTSPARTQVVVIGAIHDAHRTSIRYGTDVLARLLEAVQPDLVLTEMPPNRFERARDEYAATDSIAEPRIARFPEYVDVLFPLSRRLEFTIVPTAAWSTYMDAYRTAALRRIAADPSRQAEWREYQGATALANRLVQQAGADDPYFINSAEYDAIQIAAHEPYNRLFNHELGPGGWDNINRAYFANIQRVLDDPFRSASRIVIIYGAGHKEWFLRELRKRDDIDVLEVAPFLEQIGVPRGDQR